MEQLGLPIVVLLRQRELRIDPFGRGRGLVERGLELPHVLLGLGERGLFLLDHVFEGLWIDAKQYIAFLERSILLHWDLGDPAPYGWRHGRH